MAHGSAAARNSSSVQRRRIFKSVEANHRAAPFASAGEVCSLAPRRAKLKISPAFVAANLLAATAESMKAVGQVFNVASGKSVSLDVLNDKIGELIGVRSEPVYADFRPGDIHHSSADISKICRGLGFEPLVSLEQGLERTIAAYKI